MTSLHPHHPPRSGNRVLFSASAAVDEYVLLEVSDEQLAAITLSRSLPDCVDWELRGPPDSGAVLVSPHSTSDTTVAHSPLLITDTGGHSAAHQPASQPTAAHFHSVPHSDLLAQLWRPAGGDEQHCAATGRWTMADRHTGCTSYTRPGDATL